MKIKISKYFLFGLCYALILFLGVEISVRALFSNPAIFYKLHGEVQGLDDATQRIQWVKAYREQKLVLHTFNYYLPSRGWGVIPGLRDLPVFGDKSMNTNSLGQRGIQEYTYERVPGKSRIVVLGDSFTFGDEVSDDEVFVHHLDKMLPETEVINLGVSGYGHDQMLLTWREEGVRYQPDLVILGFVYYDMERNLRSFRFYAKPKFEIRGNKLKLMNSPAPSPENLARTEVFKLKTLDLIHMVWQRIGWQSGINERKMKRLSQRIMDEIVREVREAGAVPVFVYLCNEDDFRNYFDKPPEREQFFLDYCESRGLDCASVRPAFIERLKAGETLDTYGHWDSRGHEIAAQAIYDFLDKKGFVQNLELKRMESQANSSLAEGANHG